MPTENTHSAHPSRLRNSMNPALKTFFLVFLSLYCLTGLAKNTAKLTDSSLDATGEQNTLLNVSGFGRYAVIVKSEQGSGLQLVNRMTGPGPIAGSAGKENGRLDLFLEKGEYKIITHAAENGSGKLSLSAHSFTELHAKNAPRLIELKPIQTKLEDFQQISYWLEIKNRRAVAIEAAGRSLADMRIWKDGDWLVDTLPEHKQVTPIAGKPLHVYQLHTYLEPGLYLLTLYGGPAQIWSEQSDAQPLYIRYGIEKLSVADRRTRHISPFGSDRWLVPKPADYFRLSLPEAKDAVLRVASYTENSPFDEGFLNAGIDKKTLPPVAELSSGSGNAYQLVTVQGEAGQRYSLQHFENTAYYRFHNTGDYWVSTLHAGEGRDSIDATSILTARRYGGKERLLDSRPVTIEPGKGFQRRFNLLDSLTLYLNIPIAGRYRVSGHGKGVEARYKIEPFLTSRPRHYRSPPFKEMGESWDLDPGYYVLSIHPTLKGILDLSIQTDADKAIPTPTSSVASSTRYTKVSLQRNTGYTLYINEQPGIRSGLVLRRLPIDLKQSSLPVDQRAGESLEIPIKISEPGSIQAITTAGQALPLSISGGKPDTLIKLNAGSYKVTIKNSGKDTIGYSLQFAPVSLALNTALPPVTNPEAINKKPSFPELRDGTPAFFDLEQHQTATYNVKVAIPALYRLETAGLLNTIGNLRTRTELSLFRREANGVGRNFLIQQYLREGIYQLSINTQGKSQGHTKLSLQQTKLIDNGQLSNGIVARYTLPASRGLAYRFKITEAGQYRVRSLGPGEERKVRLEDADGWPIIAPNTSADITRHFKPGDYRLIVLPSDTESRVLSLLEKLPVAATFEGHGPHLLTLETAVHNIWREPAQDKQRIPDQWLFSLPADADTRITLDNEMGGELLHITEDSKSNNIAKLGSLKPWQGRLKKGNYRLELRNQRKNNRVEYKVQVNTEQILPGQTRNVSLPVELPLSLGSTSLVELNGFATGDVRAWLYDDKGRMIANNDDRSDDWNFLIARHLEAGFYKLRVESLDQGTSSSLVSYRIPQQTVEAPLTLPATRQLNDQALHLFPIEIDKDKTLLTVSADSKDSVGIALEAQQGEEWLEMGTSIAKIARLLLPLTDKRPPLRLRVWSVDRRGADIKLSLAAFKPSSIKETSGKLELKPLSKGYNFAVTAMRVSQPGVFAVDSQALLLTSGGPLQALQATGDSPVVANTGTLWLATVANIAMPININRLTLKNNDTLQLTLPKHNSSYLDITASKGPLLVVAESRSGQAGVQLSEKNQKIDKANNISVSNNSMISTLLSPEKPIVNLWNGDNPGETLEVSLHSYRFVKPSSSTLQFGVSDATLTAMSAKQFQLPDTPKHLRLSLPANTAAILSNKENILEQYWSGDAAINISAKTQATRLTLLYTNNSPAQLQLEMNPWSVSEEPPSAIRVNELLRLNNARSGVQQIPVVLPNDNQTYTLRIRGPAGARLLQLDGKVLQGKDLDLNRSGVLQINHQPGLMMAWLENRSLSDKASVTGAATAQVIHLDQPGQALSVNLSSSPSQIFNAKKDSVLHLHSVTPLITRFVFASGAEQVQAYPNGVAADVYLPQGISKLSISAISGQALSGTLDLSTSGLTEIGEGTGPERLLASGGGQLFGFTLAQTTTVGIGLQASSDLIHGVLMNAKGETIGRGVVQMQKLDPGHYVLAAYAPSEHPPVTIRPVLIGTKPKAKMPPDEVIRKYLQAAGVKLTEENSN